MPLPLLLLPGGPKVRGEGPVLFVYVDENKLTEHPLSEEERRAVKLLGGGLMVPTTAEHAVMFGRLIPNDTLYLLRLKSMFDTELNFANRITVDGEWARTVLAPGYKFYIRKFLLWDPINSAGVAGGIAFNSQYMVYATKM